jgi:NADPH:quinone reductase-like Zn-dependent oxidoreductase
MLMKVIIHAHYGNPEVLQVTTLERPLPQKNEVLVHVKAAGLDYGQWCCRQRRTEPARRGFGEPPAKS